MGGRSAPSRRPAIPGLIARLRTLCLAACLLPCGAQAGTDRLEALIAQMTLEEKAGQLTLLPAAASFGTATAANPTAASPSVEQQLAEIRAGRVGALFNGAGRDWARRMQQAAVRESRLGIPLLFAADVIHGYRTIFPVPLAEAASFDPQLAERTARAAATEAAADGLDWTFAPMVDISRDARWGRMVEGAGEDVLLGQRFADARVRGFQGAGLAAADAVLATPKHFAAYGAGEGGLDYNAAEISERSLREVYLPPFHSAIAAGALSIMAAFNDIAGIPATADDGLLEGVLRGEWGFRGFVVSDYTGDRELVAHGTAADEREAAKIAFMAGVDMSMASDLYAQYLPDLVRRGEVPQARLDQAVRRVLEAKQALGLFDDPYRRMNARPALQQQRRAEHRALARDAARRSMVLLKNDNELLPLPRSGMKLALIGPFAGRNDLNGPWTLFDDGSSAVSLESGIRAALRDPALLTVVAGSGVEDALPGGIEAAVAAARDADAVLLAIGESQDMSGEAQSRPEVVVPATQQALAEAVAATGKPVIVLLRNGRALALTGAVRAARALLVTWFLGSETGNAVADVLFGDYSPGGRLPVSFPQTPGQVPYHYAHKPTGRPAAPASRQAYTTRYRGLGPEPLYPFGHGLTYSRVRYDALELGAERMEWNGSLQVTARLTNTGARPVEETVQLYLRDRVASVTRPVRELRGFRKLRLAPGQQATVQFSLSRADLVFFDRRLREVAEPGSFDVFVGPSAAEGLSRSFELVAPAP